MAVASIISFTTTQDEGNARDPQTMRRLLRKKGISLAIATGKQVHGSRIQVVSGLKKARQYPGVDGFLTAEAGQPLGIFTADCASIFLSAPSQGVIGCLHAGWRGVRGEILSKAVKLLRKKWPCSPKAIQMWIGPSIGACCFEVRWDVARFFPASRRKKRDRWTVNMAEELYRQGRRLKLSVIRKAPPCTRHLTRYHSFRRDQTDQRQISVIMKHEIAQ